LLAPINAISSWLKSVLRSFNHLLASARSYPRSNFVFLRLLIHLWTSPLSSFNHPLASARSCSRGNFVCSRLLIHLCTSLSKSWCHVRKRWSSASHFFNCLHS